MQPDMYELTFTVTPNEIDLSSTDRSEDEEFVPDDVTEPSNATSDEAVGLDEGDGEKISNKTTKVSVYLLIVDVETHCFDSIQSSVSFMKPSVRHTRPPLLPMLCKNRKPQLQR